MSKQENYLKLLEMEGTSFTWQNKKHNVADALPAVFDAWIREYVETIVNVNTQVWDIFDRWQIVNAVLDARLLIIHDGELVVPEAQEGKSEVPEVKREMQDAATN